MAINIKNITKDFEKTYGYLKFEQLPAIDWSNKSHIEALLPDYMIERNKLLKDGKQPTKHIDIRNFSLRTPNNSADVFKDTKIVIEPNKRCAVFGINGSGKTLLFNAISSGEVQGFPKDMHVHHMKELEHNEEADKVSVLDTVICSHPLRRILVVVEEHLKSLLESTEEKDSGKLAKYQENLDWAQQLLLRCNGPNGQKEAQKMLRVLGFDEVGEQQPISALSGGLRMRVALACSFFIEPDLLLLDEPTNHLDMPSVLWLENRLRGYKGSFLLVTHDRILLEKVVTSVILIQDYLLQYYDMGFVEFEKTKELEDNEREKMINQFMFENRGGLDSSDPKYLRREKYRAWLSARAERQMMLAGKFTFASPSPLKDPEEKKQEDIVLINVDNVRFSYNPETLPFIFDTPISYKVKIGTRVGIMGPNGAGKSTFLKLITGKLQATEGTITNRTDYVLAYFGQHSTKELDLQMTPFEFMSSQFPDANPVDVKNHLKKTSIGDDIMNTRMIRLSFSQRSCVIFSKLTFVPPHLLIMDEPTNFLDLESVDSLIAAVNKFKGGLIVVTHNRDFLRRTGRDFLSIVPGQFLEFKTMKEAERATYSFITALEEGRPVDFKKAIQENRGGGAIQTAEMLAATQMRLTKQQQLAKEKEDAKRAEEERLAKIAADKEAKRLAKVALQKTDWVAGEKCWAPVKGNKYEAGTVVRNVPSMGVTVELVTGKTVMVEAKKLRAEKPDEPAAAEKPAAGATGGRGGARGGAAGGRGGNAAGGARGGRGGAARGGGAQGGARGGRGGRK